MFQPLFVYDSKNASPFVEVAREKGFKLIDVRQPNVSVHGDNPAIVAYDTYARQAIDEIGHPENFLPPKSTGVLVLYKNGKGHVRALPDRPAFIEWFYGKPAQYFNSLTGNYRV